MNINLKSYGHRLGPRVLGVQIKEKIISEIDHKEEIYFDLSEVKSLSTGFSKELFGELYLKLGKDFQVRVKFIFNDNPYREMLTTAINRGISASINKNN